MTDTKATHGGGDLAGLALRLHTAVPAATDHAYRHFGNPARLQHHLARRHRLDLDGEDGAPLREQFRSPEQLHRFAHEPTEARAVLAIALAPFVDQLLDILGQLPNELHPILLAETALALGPGDGLGAQPTDPPSGSGRR
jgi:hypothetical protein